MYILITNDDGVQSVGLLALRQALEPLGEIAVVAPNRNWSAGGHSRTLYDPLRAVETTLADGSTALACNGTPADCVALAIMGVLPRRPDLVVAGINRGANIGTDISYSGTVAAAKEGMIMGVPSIAVSLIGGHRADSDWDAARHWTHHVVATAIAHDLTTEIVLNVNIPPGPADAIKGVHVTRMGRRIYRGELIVRHDPYGRPYYWIGGEEPSGHADDGTDIGAVAAGYVSVTPIHLDLTHPEWLARLRDREWNTPQQ